MKRAIGAALLFVALAAAASPVFAGVTSTEGQTIYMILLADDSIEKGKEWPKSLEECLARAKAIVPKGTCAIRRPFANAGTCADVVKPAWPREVDADGYVVKPGIRGSLKAGSDSEYDFEVEDFVPGPGYPDCWVKGWRTALLEDLVDDDNAELANVEEPVTWPAELVALWKDSEDQRHARGIYYDGDQLP